jgi:hypothetical protein
MPTNPSPMAAQYTGQGVVASSWWLRGTHETQQPADQLHRRADVGVGLAQHHADHGGHEEHHQHLRDVGRRDDELPLDARQARVELDQQRHHHHRHQRGHAGHHDRQRQSALAEVGEDVGRRATGHAPHQDQPGSKRRRQPERHRQRVTEERHDPVLAHEPDQHALGLAKGDQEVAEGQRRPHAEHDQGHHHAEQAGFGFGQHQEFSAFVAAFFSAFTSALSSLRRILPIGDFGSSSRNTTDFGTL